MLIAVCVHWWLLDAPAGPTSRGVCKFCGELRHFPNVSSHMQERVDHMMPPTLNDAARAEYMATRAEHYFGWNRSVVRGIAARRRKKGKV